VKTFISVAKSAEEKRVLSRLKGRGNNDATPSALSLLTSNNNKRPKRTHQPVGHCDHCKKKHLGPNDLCWIAHPELVLDDVKKKRAETAAKKAAEAAATRTNVTVALNNNNDDNLYKAHSYVTVASFVSPDLLKKAITNHDYRKRYCYDTAANRHVFND
jgi:hypothetical protein